jgi:hypothetical protein
VPKGQKRSNREKKKPKRDEKNVTPAASPFASSDQASALSKIAERLFNVKAGTDAIERASTGTSFGGRRRTIRSKERVGNA